MTVRECTQRLAAGLPICGAYWQADTPGGFQTLRQGPIAQVRAQQGVWFVRPQGETVWCALYSPRYLWWPASEEDAP